MRALVATLAVVLVVGTSALPHVHADAGGREECAVCVLRHAAPPRSETPDLAPVAHAVGPAACAPGLPPVFGAPLGAIPGQSPPPGA